ncbi:hypothetical protein PA0552 [Candidatus Phytoplasma australiense]|uniref:Uncharacterized protein n=1 Tax=Phytoplasma australiense TaxID=59748 RepID=B1VAB3_PHYAS|nr:hypothetical protein PA0552 [Candidatus Phytoplasma australiense]
MNLKSFIAYLLMVLITLLFLLIFHLCPWEIQNKELISKNRKLMQEEKNIPIGQKLDNPIEASSLQHFSEKTPDLDALQEITREAKELIKKGLSALELKQKGYTANILKKAHFSAQKLKQLGYKARDLKTAQFKIKALKTAGFLPEELLQAGFLPQDLKKAGYLPHELINLNNDIFQQIGYKAKDFKRDFISLEQLEKKGYTIFNLIQVGYSPLELSFRYTINKIKLEACYNLLQLKKAGFSAKELILYLGATPQELKDASFSAVQLRYTGLSLYGFKSIGYTPEELKKAGFSAKDLKEMGYPLQELIPPLYSLKQLLQEAHFSLEEFKELGIPAQVLNQNGVPISQLKEAGYLIEELKGFKFSVQELKDVGYTLEELKEKGFSLEQFLFAGIKLQNLKTIYTLEELRNAGSNIKELQKGGYTLEELIQLPNVGLELRDLKITLKQCLELNCSSRLIKEFGYSKEELKRLGFLVNFFPNGLIKSITQINLQTGKKMRTNFFDHSLETCLINLYDSLGRLCKTYKPTAKKLKKELNLTIF